MRYSGLLLSINDDKARLPVLKLMQHSPLRANHKVGDKGQVQDDSKRERCNEGRAPPQSTGSEVPDVGSVHCHDTGCDAPADHLAGCGVDKGLAHDALRGCHGQQLQTGCSQPQSAGVEGHQLRSAAEAQ